MTSVVEWFILKSIGACCQGEITASMSHIHGKRMIIFHQEPEFFCIVSQRFSLPLLSPMSKPSTIDLPTKKIPFRFHLPCLNPLIFNYSIVNTDVSAFPMTLFNIFEPIDIILWNVCNVQIFPKASDCLHVRLVSSIPAVFVLDLQHDDWTFVCETELV